MSHQEAPLDETNSINNTEKRIIRIPMATFPPTAMVYSVSRSVPSLAPEENSDRVPLTLIAKVLTPRSTQRPRRLFICHKCKIDVMYEDKSVQVALDWHQSHGQAALLNGRSAYSNNNQHAGVHHVRLNSLGSDG